MTKKARLFGNRIDVANISSTIPSEVTSRFELKDYVQVSANRSNNKPIVVAFEDSDLLALQFTDNTEWIGHPEDIQEIYDKSMLEKRSGIEEDYIFEVQISSKSNDRGIIKRALVKVFSVFKAKDIAKITMKTLGKTYDKKVQPNPGIYQMDESFNPIPYKAIDSSKSCLLMLHGTLSTGVDAFGDLTKNGFWEEITAQYGKNIITYEHFTLSESPLKNALAFLKACPTKCTFDIISHSRGGLIADILAKCDFRNKKGTIGFSENELLIVEKNDTVSHKLMIAINDEIATKRIIINKVIRVASPASGTTILSRRADHFFNLLLNAISLAFGVRNPMYGIVKSFLLDLISQKDDPEILPGLNSMMPESLFQKMLNSADTSVSSDLYAISGDAEIGGVDFNSLKVILANLFYRNANDLVVDTNRMVHGVKRTDAIYTFLSQNSDTNHFNYFKNKNTCKAILQALTATPDNPALLFSKQIYPEGSRGILLDLFSLDGINFTPKEITRDVVIVLPGIMGSTLGVDGEDLWVQMRELNKGAIVDQLPYENTSVVASGVVEKFYAKLGNHLSADYDVITIAFDWRKSLSHAATILKDRLEDLIGKYDFNIHIIAHSMGGLLARQCMMDYPQTWGKFSKRKKNKYIMLGTPWLGSYLIMEVLTGHSRRVKQLATIDFKHDRKELLEIFWNYPGVFELLPIEEGGARNFGDPTFWEGLEKISDLKHMPDLTPYSGSLTHFIAYKNSVLKFLKKINGNPDFFKNIYYICGKADQTVNNYTHKNRFLSSKKKLVYKATSEGDGSVTWESGIPKALVGSSNLYYSNTPHGDLANEKYIFEGISDILIQGRTIKLDTQKPKTRGGEVISEIHEYAEPLVDSDAVVDALFDTKKTSEPEPEEIHVKVINGDLKVSSYPVMVGHFYMDLILSAEKALDEYLDDRLSQRLDIGYYPGKIGESEVFFNLNTQPKGAIVCGLGDTDTLTSFLLSQTVKMATLKYAMFMRDNYTLPRAKKYANGISLILIGIGYGKLPIEDSLKGILLGISAANKYIRETGEGLKLIKEIEILNYYESIASQAYFSLRRMLDKDHRFSIQLNKEVVRRAGAKKKQIFAESTYNWWYNLHITSVLEKQANTSLAKVIGFKYYSSKGLARIEEEMIGIGMHKVRHLLEAHSQSSQWDRRVSNTLFQMLIPNGFKNVFRNQGNMIIKLDKKAAEIPWELFHDSASDDTPVAVSSAFIRQMITMEAEHYLPVSLGNNNVLVVGDPQYGSGELAPLPAAKAEAEWVSKQLMDQGFHSNSLINSTTTNIMLELYHKRYKIMHFAGHGLYAPEKGDVGIVIGQGICIDPAMIRQLGYTPEFVFVNCCYSGAVNMEDDQFSRKRYKLAANVGTELIEMGVKAIIVAGWAVDDAAAKTFSETFYQNMFEGYDFGSSVQKARLSCYQNHQETSTWGAYQCYGNQFYKFNSRKKSKREDMVYVIPSQVHIDLDNLLIAIRDRKHNKETTLEKLDNYLERAQQANLVDAVVLEKEALIYDELGEPDIAIRKFVELFKHPSGNFSIEALEQYCVIKTHMLSSKTLKDDLKEIEFLTLVGKNPNRLNIVANAYKFASMQVDSETAKNTYLTKSFKFYEMAYTASTYRYGGGYLDALTNMIFLGHILQLRGKQKLLTRLRKSKAFAEVTELESYLFNFYQELEDFDKSDLDVSVLIGMAETNYCLMLLQKDFNPSLELDIIAKFKHIFELMYSPRYINIELLHIDFLLHYVEDDVIRKQLNQVQKEVEKLKNRKK